MKDVTDKNFGVIIAFLLPGFIFFWGLSYSSQTVAAWLAKSTANAPTVGGFLYSTIASLALGLVISAVRWLFIDLSLHWLKTLPALDFAKLKEKDNFPAFQGIVENHYRYYQYYSNTLIAIVLSFATYVTYGPEQPSLTLWVGVLAIVIVLYFASLDTLSNYHNRAAEIADGGTPR
jgi:hypothetical protein